MLEPHIRIEDLNVWYGSQHALKSINVTIPVRGITAIIGPSGCGKTTLLTSINRLLEETSGVKGTGRIVLDEADIYGPGAD